MLHFEEIFALKPIRGVNQAGRIEIDSISQGNQYMGMGLIKWTYVNIRKYFYDKYEHMWLKCSPIFKMLVVIFECLYESSWHNEKDWVIVDIL